MNNPRHDPLFANGQKPFDCRVHIYRLEDGLHYIGTQSDSTLPVKAMRQSYVFDETIAGYAIKVKVKPHAR